MIILKPIITEKSTRAASKKRFTFWVKLNSTKTEIKKAAEKIFDVKVLKVQTQNVPGKKYRSGRRWIYRQKSDSKKAVITISPEKNIDLFEVSSQK